MIAGVLVSSVVSWIEAIAMQVRLVDEGNIAWWFHRILAFLERAVEHHKAYVCIDQTGLLIDADG
jgi:hypothetical protein